MYIFLFSDLVVFIELFLHFALEIIHLCQEKFFTRFLLELFYIAILEPYWTKKHANFHYYYFKISLIGMRLKLSINLYRNVVYKTGVLFIFIAAFLKKLTMQTVISYIMIDCRKQKRFGFKIFRTLVLKSSYFFKLIN